LADRHVPELHQRDRFGRDAQWIEYHPAYRELEKAAFGEFGIHAMSVRKGILGWPQTYPVVAKHAFTRRKAAPTSASSPPQRCRKAITGG
jgi:acyl-CoA dehydrogenase